MSMATRDDVTGPLAIGAVIVNYNAGLRLAECFRALLLQQELTCIWVVDNASMDDSLESLESFADEPRLSIIRNADNLGFGAANNIVLRSVADQDWLLLNPDCRVNAGAVRAFLDCRLRHARGGLFGGLVRNPDGSEQ